ncbi:uncharacterized protein BDZ83DRAFT_648564 [Colletotrichum acutatum]|uniref:Uncharacterized protein n=1 Tax=Glomerella acutata TaxID=27357 RepID=A0AAD8UQ82_GLOAC|nr:uncharacterized protein BDZ83DRAFT_648564 [Colletotrichum acutatum]KAK1728612.1 hypothetical protein BDZ83DRAFT_648564 [Colletotrichum acutatum]
MASSPSESRPLNPNVVFRPLTPTSHHSSAPSSHNGSGLSSPMVFVRFIINSVALLRFIAVALSLTLVILEWDGRRRYESLSKVFIFLATLQLLWLTFALLVQGGSHRRVDRNKPVVVDLGCVKCIFGRRGRRGDGGGDDDEESHGGMRGWFDGDDKKKRRALGWVYTAVDITFAAISFTSGVIAAGEPYCWRYETYVGIAVVAIIVGKNSVLEAVIAIAQQFSILRRAKVQVLWDEDDEDDLGSHKYRIRLPQAPEQRHAPMSVSAE